MAPSSLSATTVAMTDFTDHAIVKSSANATFC
jgi:hypothetical protein